MMSCSLRAIRLLKNITLHWKSRIWQIPPLAGSANSSMLSTSTEQASVMWSFVSSTTSISTATSPTPQCPVQRSELRSQSSCLLRTALKVSHIRTRLRSYLIASHHLKRCTSRSQSCTTRVHRATGALDQFDADEGWLDLQHLRSLEIYRSKESNYRIFSFDQHSKDNLIKKWNFGKECWKKVGGGKAKPAIQDE